MPSVLGLGDNTIDIYVDRGMQYPGGNSLNFAVHAKRLGAESHYMGCVGNDSYGEQIEAALIAEGVKHPNLRKTANQTSWSRVRHTDNDRWFDGSHLYTTEEYALTSDDNEYFSEFDLVHVGVNSSLDEALPEISAASRTLSYDFSDKFSSSSLGRIAPFLDYAILSNAGQSVEDSKKLAKGLYDLGVEHVLVTRGSDGAICLSDGEFTEQSIIETDVMDTLGAGDAFTAAFIVEHLKSSDVASAMQAAAIFASEICGVEAAFGRGQPITS